MPLPPLVRVPDVGRPLTEPEFTGNYDNLDGRIILLEDNPPEAVSLDHIEQDGDELTFFKTDATTDGPFSLPVADLVDIGEWPVLTIVAKNNTFTINGGLYRVLVPHTTAAVFDPEATDGLGHDLYRRIFQEPSNSLPTGGAARALLLKSSTDDYDTEWGFADAADVTFTGSTASGLDADNVADAIEEIVGLISAGSFEALSDVNFSTAGPAAGEVAQYDGAAWSNTALADLGIVAADIADLGDSATLDVGTTAGTVAAGDDSRITGAAAASSVVGKQTIWVPASAMIARTTNGPATGTVEASSNKNMIKTLDFDASTQEFAQFDVAMPKSWNNGTVTFQPLWSHAATVTNFGVVFGVDAVAISDNETLDVAFGTAQTSTDTGGTTDRLYIAAESSAITIAGTPATGDMVQFRVHRDPANGSDTLAVDARLHGVKLFYTTNAATDT